MIKPLQMLCCYVTVLAFNSNLHKHFLNCLSLEPTPKPGISASGPLPDGSVGEQHISMHIYNMTTSML